MSNQHEALRLADELDRMYDQLDPVDDWRPVIDAAGEALRQIPRLEAARSSAVATNEGLASTRATLAQQPKDHMSIESLDHIVSGAIFDFAGFLTTRSERITLSAADNAGPAVDAVKAFLTLRGVDQSCEPFFQWPSRCSAVRPGGLVSPCGGDERMLDVTAEAIEAADQWLAPQPVNQCGETCERGIGEPDPESLSRQMFVARLENMQKGGGALTASAVLALLSDCDMLAANDR